MYFHFRAPLLANRATVHGYRKRGDNSQKVLKSLCKSIWIEAFTTSRVMFRCKSKWLVIWFIEKRKYWQCSLLRKRSHVVQARDKDFTSPFPGRGRDYPMSLASEIQDVRFPRFRECDISLIYLRLVTSLFHLYCLNCWPKPPSPWRMQRSTSKYIYIYDEPVMTPRGSYSRESVM